MSTDPFVGTWRLLSFETRTSSGEVRDLFGKAVGYLMYGEDRSMAVSMMRANRANFASADVLAASPEEKLTAFETYSSYCGTYEVTGEKVIHHIELSLFPNWSGRDQERFFEFSEDRLTLRTAPMLVGGVERTMKAIWQRVRSSGCGDIRLQSSV
jgi:hypothetical protein